MLKKVFIPALLLMLLSVVLSAAELPRFRHQQINVYPLAGVTKAGIKVDGSLSEWTSDAFFTMSADPDLLEIYACRIALAYDANGLYLAARFTDSSPLMNSIDPAGDASIGWAGDALQLRIYTDTLPLRTRPAAPLNRAALHQLTFWYYSEQQLPVLDLRHGLFFRDGQTLTGPTVALKFQPEPGGYALESHIPWAQLKVAQPPQPETRWRVSVQPHWGDAAGKHQHTFHEVISDAGFQFQRVEGWGQALFVKPNEVTAALRAQVVEEARFFNTGGVAAATGIPISYTNPANGFVSLAICAPDGQIVRTLLAKAPRDAGVQTENWDGLDDNGKAVMHGEYLVRALSSPGITPKFIASVHNSGNPPWGNSGGRYGWGADHGLPVDAVSDAEGNSYLLWDFNEGGDYLLQVDAAGQKQWGSRISWGDFNGGATSLVYDNGMLYVAKDGLRNGAGHGGLFAYNAKTGARVNFPNGKSVMPVTEWTMEAENNLPPLWERIRDGSFSVADLHANITGMAVSADRLFVSLYRDNAIIALDKQTFARVASYPASKPAGLAWDAATQTLLAVSDQQVVRINPAKEGAATPFITTGLEYPYGLALDAAGAVWVSVRGRQMQVLGFDRAGTLIKRIGKTGGRPWIGKFDRDGMLLPSGISVDSKGQLWVTEYDATPKRVSLWDTGTGVLVNEFFGSAAYAPMMAPDPDRPEEVYIHNTRFIVDYATGKVTPDATVYRANVFGPSLPGSELNYGFMGATFQISRFMGKTFALNGNGGVFAVEEDRFTPLLYIGGAYVNMPGDPPLPRNTPVVWHDANGDALLQADEVRKATGGGLSNNISQFGATFYPGAAFIKGAKLFRPTGLTPQGVPIYPSPEEAEPIITGTGPMASFSNWMDVWPSLASDWTDYYAIASLPRGGALDGAGMDGVYRFDRVGNIRWRYSRTAVFFGLKSPLAKIGDLYGALRIAGLVQLPAENGGEIIGIGVYRGYFGFLNEDGLFIDQIGYDNGRGPAPGFDTFFIENFSGYFFKHPTTGKVYLFCGDVDGRILELQGWNAIRRLPDGNITVSEAQYQAALAAASTVGSGDRRMSLPAIAATPALDDALRGWDETKLGTIALDETHRAAVGLAHDDQFLYAVFSVQDATPWQNGSTDWRFLFKGGDAVDIQLGAMNLTPELKRKAQPGDVRILLGPGEGDGLLAVAMWKSVPAGMERAPLRYESPVGQENFERVMLLQQVKFSLQRHENGYTLQVAIPWSELAMTAPGRTQLQGDIGVLLSDGSGTRTTGRRYLFNQETSIINDIPSEVRVDHGNWGVFFFEGGE